MHFFNPAPVLKLVEVVRTVVTDADVIDDVEALGRAARQGRRSSSATRPASSPTRCSSATSTTRCSMYESRYATREDIDAAMRLGCGLPMGPLALLDLIGLDTAYEILDTMYRQTAATACTRRRRSSSRWSPRGCWAASPAAASTPTRRPDSPVVVADELTPPADGGRRAAPAPVAQGRRRRLRHDGHRHRRGLRQGRLRRAVSSPAARTRSAKVRAALETLARQGGGARQARPRPTATPRWPGSPARPRSTTSPTSTSWSRPWSRTSASSRRSSPRFDEICKPGAVLATTTSSACRWSSWRWPPSARPTWSGCTSSTRRR